MRCLICIQNVMAAEDFVSSLLTVAQTTSQGGVAMWREGDKTVEMIRPEHAMMALLRYQQYLDREARNNNKAIITFLPGSPDC